MKSFIRYLVGGIIIAGCFVLPSMAFSAPVLGVLERPALKVLNPSECIMIDVTQAGNRLVALGEHGIIIYSDDSGKTWKQSDVPVSVTLTSACFTSPEKGWAVGHGGVVLHTADGGKTWVRQLEGVTASKLALEAAKAYADRVGTGNDAAQQLLDKVQLLITDGPDKPFLDLYFKNDQEGFVVGSYGYIFHTVDGGTTWTCLMDRADNPDGLNLYAIRASESALYISGEQGLFLVSKDNGNSFQRIQTPYQGTFFALEVLPSGEIILVGLRGNAYWTSDQGVTFNKSQAPEGAASFSDIIRLSDGTLLFANQAGIILESRDQGKTIQIVDSLRLAPISALLDMGNNNIMTAGYGGVIRVQLPSSGSDDKGGKK
jgi:photosystem II stability/assembly factor-like uncharacterized protein